VVQLYADGFAAAGGQKVLVWHLYQAALAGRDIYYDQRYRHNLAMRAILEGDHSPMPKALTTTSWREITRYTKLFWINTGPYNNLTARKFVLRLDPAFAAAVARAHASGARLPLAPGETPEALVARFAPMFFDPSFDPMVTNKTPGTAATSCGQRQQPLRRRDHGRPRGLRRSVTR
jgi:dipeptidyl-peptidase III